MWERGLGKISVPSAQFFCEPKTSLKKIKSYYKKLAGPDDDIE